MSNIVKIVIADDHPLLRAGVIKELETIENLSIVAEAGNGEEALNFITNLNPDIAILDFQMPQLTGIEITKKLLERNSSTKVILLTMHRDKKILYSALDSGIKGYVLKDDAITDIVKAINAVVSGEYFISSSLAEVLVERTKQPFYDNSVTALVSTLTNTERKILNLVSELKNNQDIADELFVSKRTVENHKVNISDKLRMKSRELLKFAIENKDLLH